jgi:hypothetical protein
LFYAFNSFNYNNKHKKRRINRNSLTLFYVPLLIQSSNHLLVLKGEIGNVLSRKLTLSLVSIITIVFLVGTATATTSYSLSISPSESVPLNTPVTLTFTTNAASVTTVTFSWYSPDDPNRLNTPIFKETVPVTVSGTDRSASSKYTPSIAGAWSIDVRANTGAHTTKAILVQDLSVFQLPEFPILGSFAGLGVMLLAFGVKTHKFKLKN